MLRNFCTSLFIIFAFALVANAQSDVCSLELKFFEYSLKNEKNTVSNLDLSIVNRDDNVKENIKVESDRYVFGAKKSGKYKLNIKKSEFRERNKEFELDCKYADKDNTFAVNVYLARRSDTDIKEKIDGGSGEIQRVGTTDDGAKFNTPTADKENIVTSVTVTVVIDVDGNVVSARAIDGDRKYFEPSEKAARLSKFLPTFLEGMPVNVTGNIIYNYVKK